MSIFKAIAIIFLEMLLAFSYCSSDIFSNKEKRLSEEVFQILSSESLYFKSNTNSFRNIANKLLTADKLKNYIASIDKYGDYFSKKEYQSYKSTLSPQYAGIGMTLHKDKNSNEIFCIPINDKLKKMGISKYDQLLSVNGELVRGKNLYIVSSLIRGKKNTYVNINIKKKSGEIISLNFKREEQHYSTVHYTYRNRINMLKIIEFKKETVEELLDVLLSLKRDGPIVIDLRDNSGGDLFSAIESVDLFLEQGTYIASIKTIKIQEDYYALNRDYTKGKTIILLQNKNTASASEVFIAALTENYHAESIGSKSYGKGIVQKIHPLSNGSAILFSYGELITPSGRSYNGKGLSPTSGLYLNELIREKL